MNINLTYQERIERVIRNHENAEMIRKERIRQKERERQVLSGFRFVKYVNV